MTKDKLFSWLSQRSTQLALCSAALIALGAIEAPWASTAADVLTALMVGFGLVANDKKSL